MSKQDSRREYAFVRFSESEFAEVTQIAESYGTTVAAMLKIAFFKRRLKVPMMPRALAGQVVKHLQQLTHFMNIVVERFDASFRQGFDPEIQEARLALQEMKKVMVQAYGNALD